MTKKSSTPAIRFKGFTDTWEQRELWELTIWDKKFNEVEAEKQPKIVKYPYVLADVFSKIEDASGDVRLLSTGNYIGYTTDEKAGKNLCVGEVVAIPWGGVPNIKYYKGKFVTADNRIATSNDTETLGNRFLSLYLEHSLAFLQSIYRGASIKHPSMNDVLSMQISIPHIQEQREIETWFANLDNLITLHQRKYDKLTNVKKSMLEKMFPKNGSNVPEIRFKGFTEAWEQRKVSDLAEKTYGGGTPTTSNEAYWNGDIPWIQSSDVVDGKLLGVEPRKWITQDGLNNSAAQLIPGNSIAIITRVGVGKLAFMPYSYATSQDFLSLSKLNAEPLFTVYACYKKLQSELNAVQGTSIKGITKDELLAKNIMVPRYAEQQQIGAFFKQLDNLITLHQRELEKLKNLKKACLEKMFV